MTLFLLCVALALCVFAGVQKVTPYLSEKVNPDKFAATKAIKDSLVNKICVKVNFTNDK